MRDAAGRSRRTRRELVNAPFGNFLGGWYRFAAYELRDGYVGPVPGAGYQVYDPWSDYRGRHRGEVVDCAHGALLRLADEADADPAAAHRSSHPGAGRTACSDYSPIGFTPCRWRLAGSTRALQFRRTRCGQFGAGS